MTTENRVSQWMQAALNRAIQIERDAAEAHRELTPYARPRRQRPTPEPLGWYEPPVNRLPVEDPPNVVFLPRRAKVTGHRSTTTGHKTSKQAA